MLPPLADPFGTQVLQQGIELLAAEAVGVGIGGVTKGEDPIAEPAKIGAVGLEPGIKGLRVVGNVALAVGRDAEEVAAGWFEGVGGEIVHRHHLGRRASGLENVGDLVGDQLGRSGHGADKDFDVMGHAGDTMLLWRARLMQYSAAAERCKAECGFPLDNGRGRRCAGDHFRGRGRGSR